MKKIIIFLITLTVFFAPNIYAQNITKSVRGQVIEKQTLMPLPGATVILLETDPIVGTTTNADG